MENGPTAAIIVIGDEILQGEVQDTNSHYLCGELSQYGVKVMKISVIPDDVEIIANEVTALSNQYTFVLTSGGIGPTHDDLTYKGIAQAFHEDLILNKEYKDDMLQLCADDDEEIVNKMCWVPRSANVHHTKFIPIVAVNNVYIFPGIPSYLRKTFSSLKSLFASNKRSHYRKLYFSIGEMALTPFLDDIVSEFGEMVQFGSYINVTDSKYVTKVTLKSESKLHIEEAEAYLRSTFPTNVIINHSGPKSKESVAEFKNYLADCSSSKGDFGRRLLETASLIEKCLEEYSPQEICLCFNGGKDCTALLHFVSCLCIKKKIQTKLKVLYVCSNEPFHEVEEFVSLCQKRYDLDIRKYSFPIKDALEKLKADDPVVRAALIGTRNTDPRAADLKSFQMTDSNWPQFMRVSPILEWSYHDVWTFLRELNIPYCSLYDHGYTSLGCRNNTLQNQRLKSQTKSSKQYYQPAYLLLDSDDERNGRSSHM